MTSGNTIGDLLGRASQLSSATPRLDLELLLCHVLGRDRVFLRAWPEIGLSERQMRDFERLLDRRKQGEPVAYLVEKREFWSLPLRLTTHALIPRPETETLVAIALDMMPIESMAVLDLGTGSGAIALALASERPGWRVDAVDIDAECVGLAASNAALNGLQNLCFWCSDWFSVIAHRYHLIVANPPYIDVGDPHLQQGDLRFEPQRALVSADGGLADIKRIASAARRHLHPGGWLMIEHGYQQGAASRDLFAGFGYAQVESIADLGGQPRVTIGCWND